MKNTKTFFLYGVYYQAFAAVFSLLALCFVGFKGLTFSTVVCAFVTAAFLMINIYANLNAIKGCKLIVCSIYASVFGFDKKQLEEKFGKIIDYTNTAVGGWSSWHGLNNFTERVLNCEVDLLVLGFGMNDISSSASNYKKNMEEMIAIFHNKVLSSIFRKIETDKTEII